MHMQILYFITLSLCFHIIYTSKVNETNEDFVPTKDWQIVKPGQKIPPGLHIRSNLQTGITEAKLLDNSTNSNSNIMLINDTRNETGFNSSLKYSPEHLKSMLKNIKDESILAKNDIDKIEINGTKFRSYEKLKEEMESVQMTFKTDLEIIKNLMSTFKNSRSKNEKLSILQDLEYYLHQIDNAQNFVDMDGLAILNSCLDEDDDLKLEALSCLASALQGNAKVKVEAIKNGAITRLLMQLKSSENAVLVNKVMAVVGAVTRQFPVAQIAFVNGGGLQLLGEIFDRYSELGETKIPLKLVTLISDWLRERNLDESTNLQSEQVTEKQNQYKKLDLNSILTDGWCSRFSKMLLLVPNLSIDYYEKVITSVLNIYPICQSNIDTNKFLEFLAQTNLTISKLIDSSAEPDDIYFSDMFKLVSDATRLIKSDQSNHEEL